MTIPTTTRPGRWISILAVVVGSIGLVFAIGGGVVRGVAAHSPTSQSWSASADGIAGRLQPARLLPRALDRA